MLWTKAKDLRAGDIVRQTFDYVDGTRSRVFHLLIEPPDSEGRIPGTVGALVVHPSASMDEVAMPTEWEAEREVQVLTDAERVAKGWPTLQETCPHMDTVQLAIPGRVMGGTWVEGTTVRRCAACDYTVRYGA